jgi:hypothetical protein
MAAKMKPFHYAYYSTDGSMSLSDIAGLLRWLGFEIDNYGRYSELGEAGRYIEIIRVEEIERKAAPEGEKNA